MSIENEPYLKAKQRLIEKSLSEEEYLTLTKKEQDLYQLSLKVDRDLVNSYETAYEEGYQEGLKLGIAESLLGVLDNESIALKVGLSVNQVEELRGVYYNPLLSKE